MFRGFDPKHKSAFVKWSNLLLATSLRNKVGLPPFSFLYCSPNHLNGKKHLEQGSWKRPFDNVRGGGGNDQKYDEWLESSSRLPVAFLTSQNETDAAWCLAARSASHIESQPFEQISARSFRLSLNPQRNGCKGLRDRTSHAITQPTKGTVEPRARHQGTPPVFGHEPIRSRLNLPTFWNRGKDPKARLNGLSWSGLLSSKKWTRAETLNSDGSGFNLNGWFYVCSTVGSIIPLSPGTFFPLLPFIEMINPLGICWADCWVHAMSTPALGSAWVSSFQKYLRGSQTCLDETVFNNGVREWERDREWGREREPARHFALERLDSVYTPHRDMSGFISDKQLTSELFIWLWKRQKKKSAFWFQSSCDLKPQHCAAVALFLGALGHWLLLK